jgi:hypothetical protein
MKAFFSCGLGDFLAIESFLTDAEKRLITSFELFTRAQNDIREVIACHPLWKDLPINAPISMLEWQESIDKRSIYAVYDIEHMRKITHKSWEYLNTDTLDFSGEKLYPSILSGDRKYNKSEFQFGTIEGYSIVIDPQSNNDPRLNAKGRNLTVLENFNLIDMINLFKLKSAYIGKGSTTIKSALALINGATHFAGVDSMAACWAARVCPGLILVKTLNPIYRKWKKIYDPFDRIIILDDFENKDQLMKLFESKLGNISV